MKDQNVNIIHSDLSLVLSTKRLEKSSGERQICFFLGSALTFVEFVHPWSSANNYIPQTYYDLHPELIKGFKSFAAHKHCKAFYAKK